MLDVLLTALSLPLLAMTSTACADPAITSAVARQVSDNGQLSNYDIAVRVKNAGSGSEPSSLLQSVQVFQNGTKVDQMGAPPLAPGRDATVHYRFSRSSEAHPNSTHFRFMLVTSDPHRGTSDCSATNNTFRLDV